MSNNGKHPEPPPEPAPEPEISPERILRFVDELRERLNDMIKQEGGIMPRELFLVAQNFHRAVVLNVADNEATPEQRARVLTASIHSFSASVRDAMREGPSA